MSQWKIVGQPTVFAPVPGIFSGTAGYFSPNGFGPLTIDIANGGGDGTTIQNGTASVLFNTSGAYKRGTAPINSPQVYKVLAVNSGANGFNVGDFVVVVQTRDPGNGAIRSATDASWYGFPGSWPIDYSGGRGEALDNVYTAIKVSPVGATGGPDPGTGGGTYNPNTGGQTGGAYGGYSGGSYQGGAPVYVQPPSLFSRLDPNLLLLGAGWLLNSSQEKAKAKAESDAAQARLDAQLASQQLSQEAQARQDERDYRLQLLNQFSANPRLASNADPQLLELLQSTGG